MEHVLPTGHWHLFAVAVAVVCAPLASVRAQGDAAVETYERPARFEESAISTEELPAESAPSTLQPAAPANEPAPQAE